MLATARDDNDLGSASMLFSTNSAMALSGLLCESAIIRIAFQSSPIRNLPLADSLDLAIIFCNIDKVSGRERPGGVAASPRPALYREPPLSGKSHSCPIRTELNSQRAGSCKPVDEQRDCAGIRYSSA